MARRHRRTISNGEEPGEILMFARFVERGLASLQYSVNVLPYAGCR
jgi:hypothetical protein